MNASPPPPAARPASLALKIALAGVAFAVILLESWIADGLKGDELFPWWPGGKLKYGDTAFSCVVGGMIGLAALGIGFLYRQGRRLLPVEVRRIGRPGRVRPRAVLVLPVSTPRWQWSPSELVGGPGGKTWPLPPTLPEALAEMARLAAPGDGETLPSFAWEQLLRAIAPHADRLQRIVLVGSPGARGSFATLSLCRQMIRHYFPSLDAIAIDEREASFDALDELLDCYREIIAGEAARKSEIMLDVTGGTKVVSIVAAIVTVEHPEIEFQYVDTEGEKEVRSFNIVSAAEPPAAV
ncbi:hypothetical protein [Accumulibacter sp.]|uniref:hypothetical protein n=1 Tax=Accumulibacter sp. TaxID=2053492 RepID=UPI00261E462A|nr:hypothetical protein [Accumulibacter sp.]